MNLRMFKHAADGSQGVHQKRRERDLPGDYDTWVDDAPELASELPLRLLPVEDFFDAAADASAGADAPAPVPADSAADASAGADAPAPVPADASDSMRLRRWRR